MEDPLNNPSSFINEKNESSKMDNKTQIDMQEEIKASNTDLNYENIFEINLFLVSIRRK